MPSAEAKNVVSAVDLYGSPALKEMTSYLFGSKYGSPGSHITHMGEDSVLPAIVESLKLNLIAEIQVALNASGLLLSFTPDEENIEIAGADFKVSGHDLAAALAALKDFARESGYPGHIVPRALDAAIGKYLHGIAAVEELS